MSIGYEQVGESISKLPEETNTDRIETLNQTTTRLVTHAYDPIARNPACRSSSAKEFGKKTAKKNELSSIQLLVGHRRRVPPVDSAELDGVGLSGSGDSLRQRLRLRAVEEAHLLRAPAGRFPRARRHRRRRSGQGARGPVEDADRIRGGEAIDGGPVLGVVKALDLAPARAAELVARKRLAWRRRP